MHQNVYDVFYDFNAPLEGVLHWMYLDIKGFVTIGVGNLIDPVSAALNLPFEYDGQPGTYATQDEISTEWRMVKSRTDLATKGANAFRSLTRLRLSDEATRSLVNKKLLANEAYLKRTFPDFENWPADAQLGVLSMAWAMGPAFPSSWPRFRAACLNQDWTAATANCRMQEMGNPGLIRRNDANQTMFTNAARIAAFGDQYGYRWDTVYYPTVILDEVVVAPEDAPLPIEPW